MPIYEYRCAGCDLAFEQLVRSMSAADRVNCPQCDGKVERQLSVFAARDSVSASAGCPAGGCDPTAPPGSCPRMAGMGGCG